MLIDSVIYFGYHLCEIVIFLEYAKYDFQLLQEGSYISINMSIKILIFG